MKATRETHGIQEDFEITPGFMLTRVPNGFPIGFIKSLDELEFVLPGAVIEGGSETKTVWLLSYHSGEKEYAPNVYLTKESAEANIPPGFTKCCTFNESTEHYGHRLFYDNSNEGEIGERYYLTETEIA